MNINIIGNVLFLPSNAAKSHRLSLQQRARVRYLAWFSLVALIKMMRVYRCAAGGGVKGCLVIAVKLGDRLLCTERCAKAFITFKSWCEHKVSCSCYAAAINHAIHKRAAAVWSGIIAVSLPENNLQPLCGKRKNKVMELLITLFRHGEERFSQRQANS